MEIKLNIYQRLHAIMKDVKYIQKGDARVNNQYRFVSHDSVVAALHGPLVKHGVVVVPSIQEITQQDNRTTVKLVVAFINIDDPKDQFGIMSAGYGIDSGDKGIGKAYSYAYKYALLKTFCLETGDDPDNDAEATYEPAKCQEFEDFVNTCPHSKEILSFIEHSAAETKKHPEDLKREAMKRLEGFMRSFEKWKKKQ
jgi:hypothetical protein